MQRLTLFCVLLVAVFTGAPVTNARPLRGSAAPRHLLQETGPIGYVPQGCQGLQVSVTGSYGYDVSSNPVVYGTVTLSNPNTFDIPIASVQVQVSNNIVVSPLFTTATCLSSTVPANPVPYQLGTTTCTYQVQLPTDGVAAGFSDWPSVMATATVGMSGTACSSSVTYMGHPQPILYTTNPAAVSSEPTPTPDAAVPVDGQAITPEINALGTTETAPGSSLTSSLTTSSSSSNTALADPSTTGNRKLKQEQQGSSNQLGYVPSGCQGLTVTAFAHRQQQPGSIAGTVVLQNPNTVDIPIQQVQVTLANNVPVSPLNVLADCPGTVVPSNPEPYQTGQMVCTFSAALPEAGPAANAAVWTSVRATATIAMSSATCDGAITAVGPPLLVG